MQPSETTQPVALRLLPSLQFTPHLSGTRCWYAVEDPQSGRFIKLGQAEYLVASGLQNGVAPHQLIQVLSQHGISEPKERVTAIITWLAKQGLLLNESATGQPGKSAGPTTGTRPAQPMARTQSLDPFFIRLPLLSGPLSERMARPWQWLVTWPAGLGLVGMLMTAVVVLLSSSERIWELNQKLFVEDGRLWWLVAWFVLKCFHEMGHAVAAVSTGSRIRSAGLHFIFMAPVPYVDVTDLWRVTNGRQRVLVAAAGMLAEMAVASVAIVIAVTSANVQLQYMCAAIATLGTVTTLAFNGNPLMKFDGYYILSDLLRRPNLWTEAQAAANQCLRRVLNPFAARSAPAHSASGFSSRSGQFGLTLFGLTTLCYRMTMLLGMAWWLLTVWHGVGAAVIAWAVWGWFVRPVWMKRSTTRAAIAAGLMPPEALEQAAQQQRRQWLYAGGVLTLSIAIGLLPAPWSTSAPGVVGYGDPVTVRAASEGILMNVYVSDRQYIQQGALIARLENPNLLVELTDTQLKYQASQEQANALRARGELALLQAEQAKMDSLAAHIQQLSQRAANLDIRAPASGMLLMSLAEKVEGRFVKPGTELCMIVAPDRLEVVASASQRDALVFSHHLNAPVTIAQTGGRARKGRLVSVDSRGSDYCEQEVLAARYSGPLAVELSSDGGDSKLKYAAPRFHIKAALDMTETADACSQRGECLMPGQLVWLHLCAQPERIWQWAWNKL